MGDIYTFDLNFLSMTVTHDSLVHPLFLYAKLESPWSPAVPIYRAQHVAA